MEIKIFIDGLNRDKARGEIAPHQIILLATLFRLYNKTKNTKINVEELINEFNDVWERNKMKFHSRNNNIGLPLKVFEKNEYINIKHKDPENQIEDYRNINNLKSNIDSLNIDNFLIQLFKIENCSETAILTHI